MVIAKFYKKSKEIFLLFKTNIKVWHILFSRAFQKYSFWSVALVIKKLWAFLDFFSQTGLFTALYPTLCIKNYKKSFKFQFVKSKKISRWYCQKWQCYGKKKIDGGGCQTPPPLACLFRVNGLFHLFSKTSVFLTVLLLPFYFRIVIQIYNIWYTFGKPFLNIYCNIKI